MVEVEPLFQQLNFSRIAPLATTVLVIVGVGFYAGLKSQESTIAALRDWIKSLLDK